MKRRSVGMAMVAAAALVALACGGGAPSPSGALDPEGAQAAARKAPRRARVHDPSTLPALSLQDLEPLQAPQADAAPRPERNLFAFEEDPALALERERQAREAREREQAAQRLRDRWQGPPLPPPPPPPPQPPAIPFTFIGYLGPPQARIGVFSMSGGKELVLARSGDRIQQKFLVKEVGFESAEIGFEGFTETRRITLTPGS